MSKWLMIIGAGILLIGAILHFMPSALGWFGKLPGDIRIQGEKGGVFIPLTSMIIISIVLTIIVNLLKR